MGELGWSDDNSTGEFNEVGNITYGDHDSGGQQSGTEVG
jgi:hypothetical protein